MNARCRSLVVFFSGLLMSGATSLFSADITWFGAAGDWNTPGNWSGGVVPTSADNAIINSGTVTQDSDMSIASITLNGGTLQGAGT
ncbi:MAG TPA: hypothetical protein VLU94_00205, partial [Candidatus Nitrosotalea sp.]|nr:hypothetical protein [Candidatus Nitrosotalea sp.]